MKPLLLAAGLFLSLSAKAADVSTGPVASFTARVRDARARAKAVWPGFDLAPLLISFPEGGTVFLDDAASPRGFARLDSGVSFKPGRFDLIAARFAVDVPFNGRSAFFFRFDEKAGDRSEAKLLVHEAFHKFQNNNWPARRGVVDRSSLASLPADEAGRIAYAAHIENVALFQALASPDRFLDEARTFVALRRRRLAAMDRSLSDALLELETSEGSAEYVALRSTLKSPLDAGASAIFLAPSLAGALFSFADLDVGAAQRLDPSVYGSGPAQMLILDRLRAPWKDRVARGETIFAVMLDAVSTDNEPQRVSRAFARWGDEGLERSLRVPLQNIGSDPDELWANFSRSTQSRVLIIIWDAKASPGLAFTGSAQPVIGPNRSSLYAAIEEASLAMLDGVSVTFRRTSVRSGSGSEQKRVGRMEQYPVEIEALLPAPEFRSLHVDGRPFSLGPTRKAFRKLEWNAPHVEIIISRPGSIVRIDGRVIVEVDPPPYP